MYSSTGAEEKPRKTQEKAKKIQKENLKNLSYRLILQSGYRHKIGQIRYKGLKGPRNRRKSDENIGKTIKT